MRFLVLGAEGQLGREFVRVLGETNKNYLALGKDKGDITNFNQLKEIFTQFKPDIVVNCAAYNQVDMAEKEWKNAYMVNGIGVRNLAVLAEKFKSIIVHFSTDYVFSGEKIVPYTIADLPNPINKYGESKLLGERFLMSHTHRFFLIRVSWVFGAGKNSFPIKLLSWVKGKESLKIVNDQISSPSYVEDLVNGVFDIISTGAYGVYHLTNSGYCSRYEWAKFIVDQLNLNVKIIPASSDEFNSHAKRPKFSVLDNFPFKEIIGYELPHWKDATKRFLNERI